MQGSDLRIPYKVWERSLGVLRCYERSVRLMEADERGQKGIDYLVLIKLFTSLIVCIYDWVIISLGYWSDFCLSLPVSTKQAVPEDLSVCHPGRSQPGISPRKLHICPFFFSSSASSWNRVKWWFKPERHPVSLSLPISSAHTQSLKEASVLTLAVSGSW